MAPTLDELLEQDPGWYALPETADAPDGLADPACPEALKQEVRWWRAVALGRAGDWDEVSALAEAGLAEPFSFRESMRLACLHCLSGAVEEAEHVISMAVQMGGDEALPGRVAAWCEREGLREAAARLR
jgi:hypothetical protein